ncbi:MAG: disulfide bond formation protein B [Salaquimonas sp.]|jgi:disulfide bond formation protein DsbB|nr:disulfide bond formation protein B [Salaquimonas sp.]
MNLTRNTQLFAAVLVFLGMAAVIAYVLGFQYIGGYIPCKLCLAQRQPYYYAFPVSLIALLSAWRGWSPVLTRTALIVTGLLLLWTCGLGIYHSGVEWGWWQGPTDCGAAANGISKDVNDLLGDLTAKHPPSCNEAAGRFLGLSFAGWNVIASLVLALIAFRGALKR